MTISTTPHLNFDGDARQALDFWAAALGTEVTAMTYGQMGASDDPAWADRIVWGQVETASGVRVMAFDVPAERPYDPGITPAFVSARGTDADELAAAWERLADGGTVIVQLAASQWSPLYGMLQDRFGVTWVLDLEVAWG